MLLLLQSDYGTMVMATNVTTSLVMMGYDPATLESYLEQSAHLMSILKISMACWQTASEMATRKKVDATRRHGFPTCTGGGRPFEVAAPFGELPEYLNLCADLRMTRIEAGEGFTDLHFGPKEVVKMADDRGLEELAARKSRYGRKRFTRDAKETTNIMGRFLPRSAVNKVLSLALPGGSRPRTEESLIVSLA